jgi:hypothetical protein
MGIFAGIAAGLVAGVILKYNYDSYLQERPKRRKLKSIYRKAFKKSDKYAQEAQCSHLIQMGNLFFDLGASTNAFTVGALSRTSRIR